MNQEFILECGWCIKKIESNILNVPFSPMLYILYLRCTDNFCTYKGIRKHSELFSVHLIAILFLIMSLFINKLQDLQWNLKVTLF